MPEKKHLRLPVQRLHLLAVAVAVVAILAPASHPPSALAAACGNANSAPTHTSRHAVARATVCLLNVERRSRNLRPLRLNARLSKAAQEHSRDMVRRHYFSHTTPDGISFAQRIRGAGYLRAARSWLVGETLAWGSRNRGAAARIVQAWMQSPPHREEILRPSFRDVGIGVVRGIPRPLPRGGATYTADFGVKR
jgi:uncharacterized protein YkwD